MPPKNKRSNANTHDRRHEGGLAPLVSKKHLKSKANGLANGHVDTNRTSASSEANIPATHIDTETSPQDKDKYDRPVEAVEESRWEAPAREHSEFEHEERVYREFLPVAGGCAERSSGDLSSDVARKGSGVQSVLDQSQAMSQPKTTIIRPLGLFDAVAILLFLMQLPPAIQSVFQFCFAYLTFGSHTSGFSLPSFTSSSNWLQIPGGHPSIGTMITVDLVVLAVWFILPFGKNFTLDLAHCAIAISLGGNADGRRASTNCIVCASIVAMSHALGHKIIQEYTINMLSPLAFKSGSWPSKISHHFYFPALKHTGARNWPRIFLEVHIITQAIIRIIRRWINRRAEPQSLSTKRTANETEDAISSVAGLGSSDAALEGGQSLSTDERVVGSSATSSVKEKSVSSGKRRRKNATHVKLQQPFWAAVADSKVMGSKDLQWNRGSIDAQDAAAGDIQLFGKGDPQISQDQVWITAIMEDGVKFCARLPEACVDVTGSDPHIPDSDLTSTQHQATYLYVRLNGTRWNAMTLKHQGDQGGSRTFEGRITGLNPSTNLRLEFVRARDEHVIFSTSLLILPVANSETVFAPQPQQTLRSSSPGSILKQSIAVAENHLTELRNNSKKVRKDNRNATSSLNREVSNLESRLSSFGNTDERQKQRKIQFSQSIKQLEDSANSIAAEAQTMGDIPDDEQEAFTESKQLWRSRKDELNRVKQLLQEGKAEDERTLNRAKSDRDRDQQKGERLAVRLSKLEQAEKDLVAANSQGQQEQSLRNARRASVIARWEAAEQDLMQKIRWYEDGRLESDARAAHYAQQAPFFDAPFNPQYGGLSSVPQTPENTFADPVGSTSRGLAGPAAFSNMQYAMGSTPMHSRRGSTQQKFRPRSSSMLSDVSGFTNDEVAPPPPIGLPHAESAPEAYSESRKRSNGSGSGSFNRSASGSQRDNNSPAPKLSPIGGRGSPWNSKPS